jgi:LPXTG-motif cell wall-anchored protein
MSSVRKRAAFTHLLDRGARRRITAAGFTALATVTFAAPVLFSTRVGAATDEPTTTTATELSIPETTSTIATTTTVSTTTATAPVVITTTPTTVSVVVAPTTTSTAVVVGDQGVVELGGDQTPVTLMFSAGSATSAASIQLPRTGAAPTLPTLTGIALLIAGALASTAKRRRTMGMIPIKSRRRS